MRIEIAKIKREFMTEEITQPYPATYKQILEATHKANFTMASEVLTCSLLRTLAASKPSGRFLEIGTGTGLSTSWILDGMDENSSLISIDNDKNFLRIGKDHLGWDKRLQLNCVDGAEWFEKNSEEKFDFIFADSWHGKYLLTDVALNTLSKGGIYVIDDMLPQLNWPDDHAEKVEKLIEYLEGRNDLFVTKQAWSSGVIIAVKI